MNISKITEDYVRRHPQIKNCLKKDLINYSKLAREIIDKSDKHLSFDAVLISLRRLKNRVDSEGNIDQVKKILKQSKIDVKNKLAAVIVTKQRYYENKKEIENEIVNESEVFNLVMGVNHVTMIFSQDHLSSAEVIFGKSIIIKHKDLLEIIIRSPVVIEEIPGIISYIYSLFGDHGVNILETVSCYTDTILIIKQKDMGKVIDVLDF